MISFCVLQTLKKIKAIFFSFFHEIAQGIIFMKLHILSTRFLDGRILIFYYTYLSAYIQATLYLNCNKFLKAWSQLGKNTKGTISCHWTDKISQKNDDFAESYLKLYWELIFYFVDFFCLYYKCFRNILPILLRKHGMHNAHIV